MLQSRVLDQQKSLLDKYIEFRFDQIKARSGTIDLERIKQNDVIFLDPPRHDNSRAGVDQFDEIKIKLDALAGDEGYKPDRPQQFFSFINDQGCHWNLFCRTIDTNGGITEKKIECKGDGACGIHAIVEAVLNSDNLKTNKSIKSELPLLGNPPPKTSLDFIKAIDFVLAIFKNYQESGNTANTTRGRIKALENLKIDRSSLNWATNDDFAIFADAVDILLLNSNLIIDKDQQTPVAQFNEQIILNILQRDDEKNESFEEFKKTNPQFRFEDLYLEASNKLFENQAPPQGNNHEELRKATVTRLSQLESESKQKKIAELKASIIEDAPHLTIENFIDRKATDDQKLSFLINAKEAISESIKRSVLQVKPQVPNDDDLELAVKVSIITSKQKSIYDGLFDNGIVNNKEALKTHVGEGMDWWVFPGYTERKESDKFTATTKIYQQLATDKEYCQRYKTFIYQYINSFDKNEKITHPPRFFKLVESLVEMTDEGKRVLAGFTQKEQDILFIAVNNFYKEKEGGGKVVVNDDRNKYYKNHFKNLENIATDSAEIPRDAWIDSAREKLRARLELDRGQTQSSAILKRVKDPIFHSNAFLDQDQIADFEARSKPYSRQNQIGCGTFEEKIGGQNVSYPFCHFRITHDPIAISDNTPCIDKVQPIDKAEYLKHPPITAICIDYPDYRLQPQLPDKDTLTHTYKQKTLETLTLYNKLEVDHLVKHGDGMGVFLKNIQMPRGPDKTRDPKIVEEAFGNYLVGFFEAITEFYQENPNATLKKITFVTPDEALERIFNEKLVAFKSNRSNSKILDSVEIKQDKAGPRFNSSKYYEQGAKKLGMTIAPHGNKKFLGGALGKGTVLEEQITLLSDMASIGGSFNPKVTEELSFFKDTAGEDCENLFYHDSKIIAFHNNIYTKFDYKKKLDTGETFASEKFSKDKEQAKILELLTIAKNSTNNKFSPTFGNDFFVAVMKVASKNHGIASIDKRTFDKDFEIALQNLKPSSRTPNYNKIPNLHEIAKDFSANFQELSRQNNYFTTREGENGKINETGRRLFRVCTEENIEKFQLGIERSPPLPNPVVNPKRQVRPRGILRHSLLSNTNPQNVKFNELPPYSSH